jgi:hypothetical protein
MSKICPQTFSSVGTSGLTCETDIIIISDDVDDQGETIGDMLMTLDSGCASCDESISELCQNKEKSKSPTLKLCESVQYTLSQRAPDHQAKTLTTEIYIEISEDDEESKSEELSLSPDVIAWD